MNLLSFRKKFLTKALVFISPNSLPLVRGLRKKCFMFNLAWLV